MLIIFAAIISTTVTLVVRRSGPTIQGSLLANQSQRLWLGDDNMLNAGDVIEIETTIFNNRTIAQNIFIADSVPVGTVCEPDVIEPQQNSTCQGTYIITQNDIDNGYFEISSTINSVVNVSSVTNLTQTTFGSLSVNQTYEFDQVDLLTVVVTLTNTGTETLLDLTSTNFVGILISSLAPMESVNFTYMQNVNQSIFLNETGVGIGTTSARPVTGFSSIFVIIERKTVSLSVEQEQNLILGDDHMLNAGDVIEVQTTITNNGTEVIFNLQIENNPGLSTICLPGGMNNTIAQLLPGETTQCFSVYVITQMDIDNTEFSLESNITSENLEFVISSETNLTQTTFPSLDVTQSYNYSVGSDFFLSAGDLMNVTVKIINTGSETILNLTSSNYAFGVLDEEFLPMEMIIFTYVYNITQENVNNVQVLLNETASGIGLTSADVFSKNNQLVATLDEIVGELQITESFSYAPECANVGGVVVITILVENIGTGAVLNVAVQDSLVGTAFVCAPMGVGNTIASILPNSSYSCAGAYMFTATDAVFGFNTTLSSNASATGTNSVGSIMASTNIEQVFKGVNERYVSWVSPPSIGPTLFPNLIAAYSTLDFFFRARFQGILGVASTSCAIAGSSLLSIRRFLSPPFTFEISNIQLDPRTVGMRFQVNEGRVGATFDLVTIPPLQYLNWDVVATDSTWNPSIGRVTALSPAQLHRSSFYLNRTNLQVFQSLTFTVQAQDGDEIKILISEVVELF